MPSRTGQRRNCSLVSSAGNPVGIKEGSLKVHDESDHDKLINRNFLFFTGSISNISSLVAPGDVSLAITAASSGMVNSGDNIFLTDSGTNVSDLISHSIISQSGLILNFDSPISNSYSTSGQVEKVIKNMANASVSSGASPSNPKIFKMGPESVNTNSAEVWHVLRLNIAIEDNTAPADNLFGGIAALTNGVLIREKNTINRNLSLWKSNADIILDGGIDLAYHQKAAGGTNHGVRARWTIQKAGASVILDGAVGDEMQIVVQDNLTGLVNFEVRGQGHIDSFSET